MEGHIREPSESYGFIEPWRHSSCKAVLESWGLGSGTYPTPVAAENLRNNRAIAVIRQVIDLSFSEVDSYAVASSGRSVRLNTC